MFPIRRALNSGIGKIFPNVRREFQSILLDAAGKGATRKLQNIR